MEAIAASYFLLFVVQLFKAVTIVSLLNFPGLRQAPTAARVVLGVAIAAVSTFLASARGSRPPQEHEWIAVIAHQIVAGLMAALLWNLVLDACGLAVQLASLQSGLSYAAIIDPTNDTESGSLLNLVQMPLLIMLFAAGIHLEFLALLVEADAVSADVFRKGFALDSISRILGFSFSAGIRLAAPFVFSMMAVDLISAISGRLVERFQLSMLVFPAKWVLTLLLVWLTARSFQSLEMRLAGEASGQLRRMLAL